MKKLSFLSLWSLLLVMALGCKQEKKAEQTEPKQKTPNIVVIYADDLGFGDVSSYGSVGLETPNFDRIASEGIRFTQGYASAPTCTPSRYSLLSGTYPFRQQKARILPGNAPLLFDVGKQTLPSMLKDAGYYTGAVGKWHLGLGNENMDWNGEIKPGPLEIGFDYCYIMASTNDRVPSVYVKDHHVDGLDPNDPIEVSYKRNFPGEPTGKDHPEMLKILPSKGQGHNNSINNGISRIGFQRGGKSARFVDEEMNEVYLNKAIGFVKDHKTGPFFLYYALHQPHVPRVPSPKFAGKSGLGPRGDVILEADWSVGQFLDTLDKLGLSENTIVVFTSDNGPVLDDGYQDDAVEKLGDHKPAGPLRGGKYSLFDAGTHVPFMIRWKGTIEPGVSDAIVSQMDFTASFASLVGQKNRTPDSQNILDAFLGKSEKGREDLILGRGDILCFRKGNWVLIPPHKGPKVFGGVNIESGFGDVYQLYNLKEDPGQQNNLAASNPEKLEELKTDFEKEKS